jgi:hypothetical protein
VSLHGDRAPRLRPRRALGADQRDADRNTARDPADVRRFVSTPVTGGNIVLVSHNFNIRALTGLSTISGEMVVITPKGNDTFEVVGRLAPGALTLPQ